MEKWLTRTKSRGVRCDGSGQEPIHVRAAYFYKGKEVRQKEYDKYSLRFGSGDRDLEIKMVEDPSSPDLMCPVCGGSMNNEGPMIEHQKDYGLVFR